ncbi:hypothetical protein Ocin01_17219 [Orchesella cincta]|uniref:Uncharacterized protein n=1 Tax=Orchesella cincta TaxID=48709 RepID=A0A1D2M977_ORCCI|nr:hypothetical protein Ocin01_17219 [Orchesella cincta]
MYVVICTTRPRRTILQMWKNISATPPSPLTTLVLPGLIHGGVQNRCGIPLRMIEPRRRNSWAVTRKPSQDSNLSSSRNDSSATSNSTATWRLSRSSVSSDAASHSGGGKSSFKRISTGGGGPPPVTSGLVSNSMSGRGLEMPWCQPAGASNSRPKTAAAAAVVAAAAASAVPTGSASGRRVSSSTSGAQIHHFRA